MAIKDRIRNRRIQLGLTLEQVAQKLNTSKQTIQRYETGIISNIPSDKIEALADILDTTPQYLMGWEEPESQPYYLDPDAAAFAQEISESPGLRALFSAARDVKEEDLRFMVEMAERFKKEEDECRSAEEKEKK